MVFDRHSPSPPAHIVFVPLSAHARLRLFRDSRLVATALMLALFPAMAVGSHESWVVTAALVMFAAFPVVIALDVRRVALLDRAVNLSLLCMFAVLAGAVLKGMDAAAATLLLAVAVLEATLVSSARMRRRFSLFGLACCLALLGLNTVQGFFQANAVASSPFQASVLLATAMAVLNCFMLVRSLSQAVQSEKTNTREQRLVGNEIGDIVSETVVAADSNGNILRVSRNCERLLGLQPATLLGKGLLELVLVSDRPAFLSALAQAVTSQTSSTLRLRLRHDISSRLPSYRWVELSAQPSQSAGGSVVATLRDVDAQVIEEERLVRAAAQAEAAKKAQVAFLATVNHELRTPLNAIIGFSDVLAQPLTMPSDPERVADYARIIRGAGHDLLRMVTTMIDITRLDSGVYEFETEMQNVCALIAATVENFGSDAENAHVKFEIVHEKPAFNMPLDARILRAIMLQLLSNAVKFGKGDVHISTRTQDGQFEICIKDQGQGIAADKLARIGRTFARLDDALNRERGGLGLGLSLANGLAHLHGGFVRMESEVGRGTCVTLCLPAGAQAPVEMPTNITALPKRIVSADTPQAFRKSRRRHA